MCICRAVLLEDVMLYAVPTSQETREAERYLERNGIRHERRDVLSDVQGLAEMARLSGQTSRPVIVVGCRVFVGFSENDLAEVMP